MNQKIIGLLVALNVASLCGHAYHYQSHGKVVTAAGTTVQGWHELPALVAFVTFMHQIFLSNKSGWHALIGKIAIFAVFVCLGGLIPGLKPGVHLKIISEWEDGLVRYLEGSQLVPGLLLVNEAVNIHQFVFYGLIMVHQLYQGYAEVKAKNIKQHQLHMETATMFLLGPLSQRFIQTHLTDYRVEHAILWQVSTYTALMVLLDQSAARVSVRATLIGALVAALLFASRGENAMEYVLPA